MSYVVKSLSLNGLNKIYRAGDEVFERNFKPGRFQQLINAGHIQFKSELPVFIEPTPNNANLTVAVSTAVWKRHDVFKMFAKGMHVLIEAFPEINFVVIVSGSEGVLSKHLVERYGFLYIEKPNEPLAEKFNATTRAAKFANPDYVLCLGSDDIIHPSLMKLYIKHMIQGYDFIGILDMYFWDAASGKCLYWGGYRDARRKNHTAGAGRLISKRLMESWEWSPWENRHSKVLDNSMQEKLLRIPHSQALINIKNSNAFALDIKSDVNMTPFSQWDNSEFINSEIIQQQFKYLPICAELQQ